VVVELVLVLEPVTKPVYLNDKTISFVYDGEGWDVILVFVQSGREDGRRIEASLWELVPFDM
jgi:hypothetical protein